jgi:hypothetical protein
VSKSRLPTTLSDRRASTLGQEALEDRSTMGGKRRARDRTPGLLLGEYSQNRGRESA